MNPNPFPPQLVWAARKLICYMRLHGTFPRSMPCSVCGATRGEAHHDDYSKPLDVVWLCRTHHWARHRMLGWR